MSRSGEEGKKGPTLRSDCWVEVELNDAGRVPVQLQNKMTTNALGRLVPAEINENNVDQVWGAAADNPHLEEPAVAAINWGDGTVIACVGKISS